MRWSKFVSKVLYKLFPKQQQVHYWIDTIIGDLNGDILQIGSNDGKTGDPLYKLLVQKAEWNIFLVEPLPFLMKRLKNNYPNHPRFHFIEKAVNDGTSQSFYYVDDDAKTHIPNLPEWFDQLGSFKQGHIQKHLGAEIVPFIQCLQLSGSRFMDLISEYKIDNLLLLHLDTEGYDWKILSQLEIDRVCPPVILFEHKHLLQQEKEEAFQNLSSVYKIFRFGQDYFCISHAHFNNRNFMQKWLLKRKEETLRIKIKHT